MSFFTDDEYEDIHSLVFQDGYPGYKPEVTEIPNGDGKADTAKRYAHVALKYFSSPERDAFLWPYLGRAHVLATKMALSINMPVEFLPRLEYSALRILDYPAGAVSNRHEDFDLFTVMCYRNLPQYFKTEEVGEGEAIKKLRTFNAQCHLGQLGTEIGLGPATPHWVEPAPERQLSIVYFAIPDWTAVLPSGITVKDWLNSRMSVSRTKFIPYK